MRGGVTYEDMDRRKQADKNVKEALEYLRGRQCCEYCMTVERILSQQVHGDVKRPPSNSSFEDKV